MRHIHIKRADREPKPSGWLIRCARARVRNYAGMSQPEVAAALGTGATAISRIENGGHCGPLMLARLALLLGVAVESLAADAEQREVLAVQRSRWVAAGRPELGIWLKSEGL